MRPLYQGSEAAALEESDNFAFEFPVQDGLSTKRLEVRIKIGKDPIDKSILALASLSEVGDQSCWVTVMPIMITVDNV